MNIGKVKLKGKVILAPLAGVTNLPFRLLCKKQGAALVYSEMINLNALARKNKATEKLCLTCKEEKPVSFQLFGLREEAIKKSVEMIEDKADIIDFNFGCPAHQIVGSGSGSALLKRPEKMGKIIAALVKYSSKPVTAKIRLGYDKNIVVKLAKIIEENGAAAIAIHGRTYKQGFSGQADWKAIAEAKEAVNIPIIGNGDVINPKQAEKLLKKCDAVMIGRAAIGDPMIFHRVNTYLKTGKLEQFPSFDEKLRLFLEYYKIGQKYDLINLHTLRQRAQEFTKGIRGSTKIRKELNKFDSVELMVKYMKSL